MDKIHLKSPRGWINDPNGFIYYKGKYHLFYQHFPYALRWGRMHWGHAVSDDLVHWEHLGIALFPSKTDDMDGCFSGSAIERGGALHLIYTGVRYELYDPENTNCNLDDKFISAQLSITSKDGFAFDNFADKRTVVPPLDGSLGDRTHTRDPKVWRGKDGNYYMVLGTTVNEKGRLLFYRSADLSAWEYVSFTELDGLGWMWECPDYFEADDKGVLIMSPIGLESGSQTICTFADFDEKECRMTLDSKWRYFDYGLDLYAPQSTLDKDGRRTVIAWLRMPEASRDNAIGMYCIPRICEVKNGHIYFAPHPDVKAKFSRPVASPAEANGAYLLRASLDEGDSINVGGYIIGRTGGKIFTDRSAVINGNTKIQNRFETPAAGGFDVEAFVDENIIEVYVNGGEYVITNAVYGLSEAVSGEGITLFGLEEM